MAGTFKFELVSPERILLSTDAEQVVLPGMEGDFTVLTGHAPVISTLRPGVLDVALIGGRKRIFVKAGFAEVDADRLTVLAQQAVDVDELAGSRLTEELRIAEAELSGARDDAEKAAAEGVIEQLKRLQAA